MTGLNLRKRLLALSILPSALLAVTLVAYYILSGMHAMEGELRERGMAIVRYLAPVSEYGVIAGHFESLQSLVHTTLQQPGVKAAIVVGRGGKLMAVSGRVSLSISQLRRTLDEPCLIEDNEQWIAFGAPVLRSLAESDSLFDPASNKAAPEIIGQIFVEFDKSELQERQRNLIQLGLFIIVIGLLTMALIALGLADSVTRPVTRLVEAVRAMALGQFDTRIKDFSFGEFRELEQGFNDMASHIAEVRQTMQERIEEATAQLAYQARHDVLTGLVNRREFEARLERAIASVQVGGEECTLLFVDLDRFKTVNDTCGHLGGDELLRQVSRLFQGRLRQEDTLARIGGDEFSILLVNCSGNQALQVANDLCEMAGAYRFIWQDRIFAVGASIGLTPIDRHAGSVTELLAAADSACYTAKEMGRNRVQIQTVRHVSDRRQPDRRWESQIASALAENRLILDAFPLRRLSAGLVPDHFVEIAARLDDRSPPSMPSSILMDAAERYELAPTVDRHVLEAAIATLVRVTKQQRQMRCLVPLSSASVQEGKIIEFLANALISAPEAAKGLYLLLTEECAVQHASQVIELCQRARALGCRIALGQFGSGFASFSHMRSIKPDCIKIHRSLTRDFQTNRISSALLRAIQEIADDQGAETVAEGVDDLATFDMMMKLGITYAQGRAAAPSEPFTDWIEGAVMRGC